MELYHGSIVYARSETELVEHTDSYLAVENGVVAGIFPLLPEQYRGAPVIELGEDVLIPAFTDLHVHAPQYPQRGLAMDELLPDWLAKHTFPLEARYADPEFARAVRRALRVIAETPEGDAFLRLWADLEAEYRKELW